MFSPTELIWALIGLFLTIGGTFLPAFITSPPWAWSQEGVATYPLDVTCQIGAVLLVGCVGGKNAGALSQIAYLILGLTWFKIFSQGGGIGYIKEPSFGYLLGFVPGAWVCGYLAFRVPLRLESLAFSALCGMLLIHLSGITYLIASHLFKLATVASIPLLEAILRYSLQPLPGQLVLLCAVAVLAYALRHALFLL